MLQLFSLDLIQLYSTELLIPRDPLKLLCLRTRLSVDSWHREAFGPELVPFEELSSQMVFAYGLVGNPGPSDTNLSARKTKCCECLPTTEQPLETKGDG